MLLPSENECGDGDISPAKDAASWNAALGSLLCHHCTSYKSKVRRRDESSCPCPFLSDTKVVDELDGLFRERDGEDYDVGRNLKMEFLQLWDGVRDCLDDK